MTICLHLTRSDISVSEHQQKAIQTQKKIKIYETTLNF